MTELEKLFQESKAREEKPGRQSDESLRALTNDLGLIVNPSLRIAASVASETLTARTEVGAWREMVEKTISLLKTVADCGCWNSDPCDCYTASETRKLLSEIESLAKQTREKIGG